MRVIAGKYRSRPLNSLPGKDLRPTADRLRETLFNVLGAGNPSVLEGTIWIDLFAGTGAVGIEAISRGCGMVYFVDSAPAAASLIRRNLRSLKIDSGFEVINQDAILGLRSIGLHAKRPGFVFLDPPYQMHDLYLRTLAAISTSPLLQPETVVVAEHAKKHDPGNSYGDLQRYRTLTQGDGALSFYRLQG